MNDGVCLQSISHPVPPWYKRLWNWFKLPKDISEESLETVEIEIRKNIDYKFLNMLSKLGVVFEFGVPAARTEDGNPYLTVAFKMTKEVFEDEKYYTFFIKHVNITSPVIIRICPEYQEDFFTGEVSWRFRFFNEGFRHCGYEKEEGANPKYFNGK